MAGPTASRPCSPAAERNKGPILEQLRALLPARGGLLLEIASGSGQHAAHFAAALPHWRWQPSERDDDALAAIEAWRHDTAAPPNLLAALRLDVTAARWPLAGQVDAMFCANLLHIAPWPVCAALMSGAARHLTADGVLLTYGPYLEAEVPTTPSNLAFDADLRRRDAAWGLRHLDDVAACAAAAGLRLDRRIAMPSNNLLLAWRRHRTFERNAP
jgi:hypothetical protein